jgi:lipopolysaccharide export system permease protein
MTGTTLSLYLARRFTVSILGLLLICLVVILIVDFVQVLRSASEAENFTIGLAFLVSAFRVPVFMEQVIPFGVLFGSIAAFLTMARRLELVIIRAAGVSVWQFAAVPMVVVLLVGVASSTLYNPLAAQLKLLSDDYNARMFGANSRNPDVRQNVWLRQDGADGESILRANSSLDQGRRLVGVLAIEFTGDGQLERRIDARDAVLQKGRWILRDVKIRTRDDPVRTAKSYEIATNLVDIQVRETYASPDSVSFWDLPTYITLAEQLGLPAFRYRYAYQSHLARPVLLGAMLLIAATVSLRVFRFGNIGRLIISGVAAGFVLYVVMQLARDLGGVGIVPPLVAAWFPPIVAALMGFTVLLHQEDG